MNIIGPIVYFATVAFFLTALVFYFVSLGLRPLVMKRPVIFRGRWVVELVVPPVLIIESGVGVRNANTIIPNSSFAWLRLANLLFVAIIAMLGVWSWRQMRGFMALGITEASLQSALRSALDKLNLPFQETPSAFHLTSQNADVQVSVDRRAGYGRIYVKPRNQAPLLAQIVKAMREYFEAHLSPIQPTGSRIFMLLGVVSLAFLAFWVYGAISLLGPMLSAEALRSAVNMTSSVAFSPDGKTLASGGGNGAIRLWDVATGHVTRKPLTGHTYVVNSLAFSPDGKALASSSFDGTARLWDLTAQQPNGQLLIRHTHYPYNVAFSPDGKLLATGGYSDLTVHLWDVATGQLIGEPISNVDPESHFGWGQFWSLAFSPDSKTLATGTDSMAVRRFDVGTRQAIDTLFDSYRTLSVVFSPNGTWLAAGSQDHSVALLNVETGRQAPPLLGHSAIVNSVAFSPDSKTLASGSDDGTIRLWDVATQQAIGQPLTGHTDFVYSVAFSPDGSLLASGSADNTVRLWDVKTATQRAILQGHTDTVDSVVFSPNGKTLASGSLDGTIRLWDMETNQPAGQPINADPNGILNVALSPDGKMLAASSLLGMTRLWNVATRQPIGQPLIAASDSSGRPGLDASVAFSADGTTLIMYSPHDSTIRRWDTATRQPIGQPAAPHGLAAAIYSLASSPDGKTVATGGPNNVVYLLDTATGDSIGQPLAGHTKLVTSLAFSPDGKTLASGSWDQTIRLWDVKSGTQRADLQGHTGRVGSLAFSPDGKTLASGGDDKTIRLWDVATGKLIGQPLTGNTFDVTGLAFSPDGTTLAAASEDQAIRLWDLTQNPPTSKVMTP